MIVYLAGGMRSGWQGKVMEAAPQHTYLDPRTHGWTAEGRYTLWDLAAIRQADLVFAYLEHTNPAGTGMALEVGFARALGKQIIYVDEMSVHDARMARYLGMVRACADVVVARLDDGIVLLQSLP